MPPVGWPSVDQKEFLWEHLDEFIEIQSSSSKLKQFPDFRARIFDAWFKNWPTLAQNTNQGKDQGSEVCGILSQNCCG